jgi:predicted alpha/beta superfamily hydrolase
MKFLSVFVALIASLTHAHGQFQTKMHTEYSGFVGDNFDIYISLPPNYNRQDRYNVIYYCDANLKSGKYLRKLISTREYKNLHNSIFVGIGHVGNFHVLRRRDFILPTIEGTDTAGRNKNYGQTENFYSYLKHELVPFINSKFKTNPDSNSILGHSLGGLFTFFCLFKSDNLFSKYFALSPALWIDKYSIYKFNHIQKGFSRKKYLYFASGSKETVNKILKGTNEVREFLDKQQYDRLTYDYDIWNKETHNSEVTFSLQKILKEKL